MNGKNIAFDVNQSTVKFRAALLGNTTSAPTIPADGRFLATTSTFPSRLNAVSTASAEAPGHTSTGIVTFYVKHSLVNMWPTGVSILKAGASPTTALYGIASISDPSTRQVTVRIYTPGGTLTDPGVNDMIVVSFEGQDSTV